MRLFATLFGLIGATLIAGHASQPNKLILIADGLSSYEILVSESAFPTTRLAAHELQHYLAQSTGVELPIVAHPTYGRHQIVIARSDDLAPHGLRIDTAGTQIWLRGRDSDGERTTVDYVDPIHRGTCNAVYEFLERFVGVRWFWGDELGDVIPKLDKLVLPAEIHVRQEPLFDYRALPYGPTGSFHGDWARRNRLGAATTMHHAHHLHEIVPIDEWARRGREDFAAMINGERKTDGRHVCTSNADVVALVAEAADAHFDRLPGRTMFSISPPDGSGLCQCPVCRALDVDGYKIPRGVRKGRPVMTDRILCFYNAVAERTVVTHPDRLLGGYVYADYLYPPRRVMSAHRNVALVVAPNVACDILDDGAWVFARSIYHFWGWFHDQVYAYDTMYRIRNAYGLPAPLGDRMADLIRCCADSHIRGCYFYIGPTWESFGPGAYLAARLLWDPTVDVRRTEDEYYRLLYGEAAPAVRVYFAVAEDCLKRATGCDPQEAERLSESFHRTKAYARDGLARLLIGYADAMQDLEAPLRTAEYLAASDPTLCRRVARLRDNFTLASTTCRGLQSVVVFERAGAHDPTLLVPLVEAISLRDALLTRTGKSYAGALEKALRETDENIQSPLQPGGYYETIARGRTSP